MSRHEHLFDRARDFCENGYPAVGAALREAVLALEELETIALLPSAEWKRRLKDVANVTIPAVEHKTAKAALSFDLVTHPPAQRAIADFALTVEFLSEFDVTLSQIAEDALNQLRKGPKPSRKTNTIMMMRANIRQAMSYIDDAALNSRLNAALLPA
ncbi:hypothetical protein [Agrobacterium pusense]|uniref:Uncharacterized protein n=1 Tax=Agrobacterium pusense TaxID=648995 RepID=U4Q4R7_9HYPH|nr:hypothetical protein [Agrobacterium pusense]CDI08705.1 protein of unknown function [Agrobacterium pusense]